MQGLGRLHSLLSGQRTLIEVRNEFFLGISRGKIKKLPRHKLETMFFFALGLFTALPFFPPEVRGADWKFIEKDGEGLWVYNAETVECFANHRIKVQTRKIYEREAVLAAVDKYGKGYENLDHVLAEWEIDCFQRKFRLCSAIFFSKENAVIERYSAAKEGCLISEEIPPDSYMELLRKKVCR